MVVLDLYPAPVYAGVLTPAAFDADIDGICDEIEEAFKGWGSDKGRLVAALKGLTPLKRMQVSARYHQKFDAKLSDKLKDECGSGDFGQALQFITADPVSAECAMINESCSGLGTHKVLLFTILSGRSNKDVEILKKQFFDLYGKDLGQVLDGELGGAFEKFVFNVLQADEKVYDAAYFTEAKVQEDIKELYEMGQGQMGSDAAGLFKILVSSPAEHIQKLNLAYAEKYGYTLSKLIETELSGKTDDAASFMLGMKLKPYEEVAKLIRRAAAGMGCDEFLLTSTLLRYQIILKEVNVAHVELYKKSITDRLEEETKGDLKELLLGIVATAEAL